MPVNGYYKSLDIKKTLLSPILNRTMTLGLIITAFLVLGKGLDISNELVGWTFFCIVLYEKLGSKPSRNLLATISPAFLKLGAVLFTASFAW